MKHKETRMKKAENWEADDFLKGFTRALKNKKCFPSNDYLIGMNPKEIRRLRIALLYDIIEPIEKIERDRAYVKEMKARGLS